MQELHLIEASVTKLIGQWEYSDELASDLARAVVLCVLKKLREQHQEIEALYQQAFERDLRPAKSK